MPACILDGLTVFQNFDLLGIARADLGSAPPLQPAPRPNTRTDKASEIDASGRERSDIFSLDADGDPSSYEF